jgi:hypothetical protein
MRTSVTIRSNGPLSVRRFADFDLGAPKGQPQQIQTVGVVVSDDNPRNRQVLLCRKRQFTKRELTNVGIVHHVTPRWAGTWLEHCIGCATTE